MRFKKVCIALLIITLSSGAAALLYVYAVQERFISIARAGIERSFSEATGADVKIGVIGADIFNRLTLRELSLESEDYKISFDKAKLGATLLEVLFFERVYPEKGRDIKMELDGGTLILKAHPVECRDIKGRISLGADRVILDPVDFNLSGMLDVYSKGEVITGGDKTNVNMLFKIKPFFNKRGSFFEGLTIRAKGPCDNLTIYAALKNKEAVSILLDGYLLSSDKSFNLGARIRFADGKGGGSYNISMDTEVDSDKRSFDTVIIPPEGSINIRGDYSAWPSLRIDADTQHIKIGGFDFLNRIHILSDAAFDESTFSHITLEAETESSVFNYRPMDELEASFWIDTDRLRIIYIKIGDTLLVSGSVVFAEPLSVFIKTTLSDFDVGSALALTDSFATEAISCRVSGDIFVEGPLDGLVTKARLEAGEGYLGTVDYKSMILNLKGAGPMLRVYESRLIRDGSFLTLDGTLDLRRLGSSRFMDDITISTDEKTIIWEGWDISRVDDEGELTLKKGVDGGLNVGFKTHLAEDETSYQVIKPQDELKLEYGSPEAEGSLQVKAKENEDFFGVIKRYRF